MKKPLKNIRIGLSVRALTLLSALDFESSESTNSATSAYVHKTYFESTALTDLKRGWGHC